MTALARNTDPATSHAAGMSVSLSAGQLDVMSLLSLGPGTDEELYERRFRCSVRISPSGLRTRRVELVRAGLVRDTGVRVFTATGRGAIVWEAT